MKPSIVAQPLKEEFLNQYPILETINVASNGSVAVDFNSFHQYRFSCTVDKFFTLPFLELAKTGSICLRSVSTFSEQSELTVSLDLNGKLLLTMSERVYESSGLDAAQVIVDSLQFSSTARLLSFDLIKLSGESNHLKRVQERSLALSEQVFSCEFVALSRSRLDKIIGVAVAEEPLPRLKSVTVESFGWSEEDEGSILQEKIEWMSLAVKKPMENEPLIPGMSLHSIEGPVLPSFLISQLIENRIPQATHFIISAKAPSSIPIQPHLNRLREAHFNASKFDSTISTADQQGFFILKTPTETTLFTLNTTA